MSLFWGRKNLGHDRRRNRSLDNVDPIELIRQEKLSRQLHTPLAQGRKKFSGSVFEQFLVIGSSPLKSAATAKAEVLFKYPEQTDHELQALEEFCFPSGMPETSPPSKEKSVVVYHHKNQHNSYMFMFTSEIKEIFYAVCVKDDFLSSWPTFIPFPAAEEANLSFKQSGATMQNLSLRILENLYKTALPGPGQQIDLPFDAIPPFKRSGLLLDEEKETLGEFCFPPLFYSLGLVQVLFLISALLLERKIVFTTSNLRILATSVLGFIPLLRPFILQCVIIPIIPDRLIEIAQSPVPFMMGMSNPDLVYDQIVGRDIIIVDLDQKRVHCPKSVQVPPLPNFAQIIKAVEIPYNDLVKSMGSSCYSSTKDQQESAKAISHLLEGFLAPFFEMFKEHCVSNLTDNVTVFLKESFLSETSIETLPFFEEFLETQIFQAYCDKKLKEIDNYKERLRPQRGVADAILSTPTNLKQKEQKAPFSYSEEGLSEFGATAADFEMDDESDDDLSPVADRTKFTPNSPKVDPSTKAKLAAPTTLSAKPISPPTTHATSGSTSNTSFIKTTLKSGESIGRSRSSTTLALTKSASSSSSVVATKDNDIGSSQLQNGASSPSSSSSASSSSPTSLSGTPNGTPPQNRLAGPVSLSAKTSPTTSPTASPRQPQEQPS